MELSKILGYLCGPQRSPVDACTLLLREWSAKMTGGRDELKCTGLLQDTPYLLQVDSAISVDLMDACVGALSSMLEGEVFILQARNILPVMEVLKTL